MQILPNGHNVVVSNAWLIFTNLKPIRHFIAPECRILLIQWVGESWESICLDNKKLIICSFRKCGITVAPNGVKIKILIFVVLRTMQFQWRKWIKQLKENVKAKVNLQVMGNPINLTMVVNLSDLNHISGWVKRLTEWSYRICTLLCMYGTSIQDCIFYKWIIN